VLLLAATATFISFVVSAAELETVPVRVDRHLRELHFDGVVESMRRTPVASQIAGTIASLSVQPGDQVAAGEVLARVDARAAMEAIAVSRARAEAAAARLALAAAELRRQKELHVRGMVSQSALEESEAAFKLAQTQAEAERANVSASKVQLDYHEIRAPYAGIIESVPVTLGSLVLPGGALAYLYDAGQLRVTVRLPEQDALAQVPAAQVRIEWRRPSDASIVELTPKAIRMIPAVDTQSHNVEAWLMVETDDVPAPGTYVRVVFPGRVGETTVADDRFYVPTRSLVQRAEVDGVYVIDEYGQPTLRLIRRGPRRGSETEVLSGLNPGERVALNPDAAAVAR
jgi:multidrug efflux system membrane fusion protein